jgi:hypothetical protein
MFTAKVGYLLKVGGDFWNIDPARGKSSYGTSNTGCRVRYRGTNPNGLNHIERANGYPSRSKEHGKMFAIVDGDGACESESRYAMYETC